MVIEVENVDERAVHQHPALDALVLYCTIMRGPHRKTCFVTTDVVGF
jgi:hypothetical protein